MEKGGTAKTLSIASLVVYIVLAFTAPFNSLFNSTAALPYFLAFMAAVSMVNVWLFATYVIPPEVEEL